MDDLTAAGFFGKSSDPAIKVNADTGAKNETVSSLEVDNLHLCCGSCVKAVNAVLADVPGYKTNDAKQGAKSFTITGNINPSVVFAAFQKAGLTGKAGATKPVPAAAPKS
jgi:copper chaperone CopZ